MPRKESHILTNLGSFSFGEKSKASFPLTGSNNAPSTSRNISIIKEKVASFATARYGHPDGPISRPADNLLYLVSSSDSDTEVELSHWESYPATYKGWSASLLKAWIPNPQNQAKSDYKLLKFNISPSRGTTEVVTVSEFQRIWTTVNLGSNGIACIVCSPTLSWDMVQILGTRYDIHPTFFIPSWAQPMPLELHNNTISVRLGFPRHPDGLWLLDDTALCNDDNYKGGRIEMDSYRLYVKDVDGVPSVVCFASSDDVPNSIVRTFGNAYWKARLQNWQSRDLHRLLPLPFIWYAVRRWDEICEGVSTFAGLMEAQLHPGLATRLHFLRAHILFSEGLLNNLKVIVTGLQEGCRDQVVLNECKLLLDECVRLEFRRKLQGDRVQNIIDMIYSHSTTRAAEATVRDSRDMMQISRLTMLFLPASVMAGIFGINSTVIDQRTSLVLYLVLTVPLTIMTIWAFVAMQIENYFQNFPRGAWYRFFWPYYIFRRRCDWVEPIV